MSIPQILEVAIGLMIVYYLLGLFVSYFTNRIKETLETRGKALETYLIQIMGDKNLGDFLAKPQIKSLAPIRYKNWLSLVTGEVVAKKVEKIPLANLTEAFFDFCGGLGKEVDAKKIKAFVATLPNESEAKKALQDFVDQKVKDVNQVRTKITMWFDGLMDQAAAAYKAQARRIVVALSLLVTLAFAVDSIDLAQQFWHNAELRAIANAKATQIVQQGGTSEDLNNLIAQLGDLNIKLGWGHLFEGIPGQPGQIVLWVLLKLIGLTITTGAISQGSSFWYDALRNITGQASKPSSEGGGATQAAG